MEFYRMEETTNMKDTCTYYLEVEGRLDESTFNANSPLRMRVEYADQTVTQLSIRTDQSGVVGFIRHLHGQGFVLLALSREQATTLSKKGGALQ
jgi:hypothetical protein